MADAAAPPRAAAPLPRRKSFLDLIIQPMTYIVMGLAVLWVHSRSGGEQGADTTHVVAEHHTCAISPTGEAVQRFAHFLTFKTVGSNATHDHIAPENQQQFVDLLAWMEATYPLVYSHLEVEQLGVGGWSRLLTWKGSDVTLNPVMFISHFDVVPVPQETEQDWLHGAFEGKVVDGMIWGRGALDVKYSVTSLLEAVTLLLTQGYTPRRTVMLCFGHDEELGGTLGAALVAKHLEDKGVTLDAIVDEGGVILQDGVKGLTTVPVALIGTAEKVYLGLEVVFHSGGGHSSMPPTDHTDIGSQFARFLAHLGTNKPKPELRAPITDFLQALGPHSPSYMRPLLANVETWPLSQLVAELLVKAGRETAALVRTTVVATKISAGVAENVLPQTGSIVLNLRYHPDVSSRSLIDYVTATLSKAGLEADVRVTESTFFGPPGKVTPSTGRHFLLVKQAIQEYFRHGEQQEAVPVAPYMLTGGTDSKHFAGITANGILRFVPYHVLKSPPAAAALLNSPAGEDVPPLSVIHATNERVKASDYAMSICVYQRMVQLLSAE